MKWEIQSDLNGETTLVVAGTLFVGFVVEQTFYEDGFVGHVDYHQAIPNHTLVLKKKNRAGCL